MTNYGSILAEKSSAHEGAVPTNLKPSNNSTDDPIKNDNHDGEVYQRGEESIQLLPLSRKPTFHEMMEEHVTGPRVRSRNLLALVAAMVAVALSVWFVSPSNLDVFSNGGGRAGSSGSKDSHGLVAYGKNKGFRPPFSTLDPVKDLGLPDFDRPKGSKPSRPITGDKQGGEHRTSNNYPTNTWYQSLLMPNDEPDTTHRAYAIPYIVDAAGPMPGLRVHPNHIDASSSVVQVYVIEEYGLTVGATADAAKDAAKATRDMNSSSGSNTPSLSASRQYTATHTTPLGLTLAWKSFAMDSSITKGMPYATMRYQQIHQVGDFGESILPTVAAEVLLAKAPLADMKHTVECTAFGEKTQPFLLEREVEVFFQRSDFTWLIFVSEPVRVQCVLDANEMMRLQVVSWGEDSDMERDLIVRIALAKKCTSGVNPIYCHQERLHPTALMLGQGHYVTQLRDHVNFYSGPNTTFDFYFENETSAVMVFDWDIQDMRDVALHPIPSNTSDSSMIVFALPHHFDIIQQRPPTDHDIYCVATLTGPACLYEGPVWELKETIPEIGFQALRPPAPWAIPSIVNSLKQDLNYSLPDFYRRGAGDTYFSGKMLAKLGRILLIAEEVDGLCSGNNLDYQEACQGLELPSQADISKAVDELRSSVEVWINGTAEIPFVYDSAWGGVVSCGCDFDGDKSICKNKFPKCTGFYDPGLNFGNAFYNDMHFHYGYFIFGAAVVAHFDPAWGRSTFEQVLLLIRCIANPSEKDKFFPTWRHKDWYQGHSWASGIAVVFLNGKNQESSSESIAAYEAIALYGKAMVPAWKTTGSRENAQIALDIEQTGQLMTVTELRSAKTYWHVTSDQKIKVYPSAYTARTIGILWQTMAQCQTWFGSAAYLAYGIQLLPITPIAEYRDTPNWVKEMYHIFAEACSADPDCTDNGWSVIQLALLGTVGHQQDSSELAMLLPSDVFESAGGNGHSLTNTLWFLSTRPELDSPLPLTKAEIAASGNIKRSSTNITGTQVTDCGRPDVCTDYVLDTIAGEYSCRQRINWLIQQSGQTEAEACNQIAVVENQLECGACDPASRDELSNSTVPYPTCPQCTHKQCESDLNRCPQFDATFVCTDGDSVGGCSRTPWDVPTKQCRECCELTRCAEKSPAELRAESELHCPQCTKRECRGMANRCDRNSGQQYLCLEGASEGGCALLPWAVKGVQCLKCCTITSHCRN